jgi:CDC45-like protein
MASCKFKPCLAVRRPIQELRLQLLRHWSLLEALANSPYVATRLLTWLDRGQELLQELLVVCGLPLAQSRLAYSEIPLNPAGLIPKRIRPCRPHSVD